MKLYLFIFWLTGVYCKYFFLFFNYFSPDRSFIFVCQGKGSDGQSGVTVGVPLSHPSPGGSAHVTAHIVFGEKSTGL